MKRLEIYIDGAAKGNPGPAGIGVVICQDGEVVKNIAEYIGNTTNNVAEYTAFIYGLEESLSLEAKILTVNTDSQLLYRQIRKEYKVKSQNILALYQKASHLISGFKEFSINHIPREKNCGADKLANIAIKKAARKSA